MPSLRTQVARDQRAFIVILRTGKDDRIADVALHLPNVAGVRFQDIHGVECHPASILLVQLVKGGNLPPEWRSGVAAEDEYNRLLLPEGGKLDLALVIQCRQLEIGRMSPARSVPARARVQKVSNGMIKYAGIGIFAMTRPKVSGGCRIAQLMKRRKASVAAEEDNGERLNQDTLGRTFA